MKNLRKAQRWSALAGARLANLAVAVKSDHGCFVLLLARGRFTGRLQQALTLWAQFKGQWQWFLGLDVLGSVHSHFQTSLTFLQMRFLIFCFWSHPILSTWPQSHLFIASLLNPPPQANRWKHKYIECIWRYSLPRVDTSILCQARLITIAIQQKHQSLIHGAGYSWAIDCVKCPGNSEEGSLFHFGRRYAWSFPERGWRWRKCRAARCWCFCSSSQGNLDVFSSCHTHWNLTAIPRTSPTLSQQHSFPLRYSSSPASRWSPRFDMSRYASHPRDRRRSCYCSPRTRKAASNCYRLMTLHSHSLTSKGEGLMQVYQRDFKSILGADLLNNGGITFLASSWLTMTDIFSASDCFNSSIDTSSSSSSST